MCNPQGCEDQVTLKHRSAQRNQTAVHKTQSSGPFPTSLPSSELVSQKCPCQTRNMTTEHLLQACPQSLNHHLFIKFRIGQSELCLCQTGNMTTEHLLQACPQSPEPPPLYQVQNWSVRIVSLSDRQHDNRTSAAGMPTTSGISSHQWRLHGEW